MKWPLFENKIGKEMQAHRAEVDADAVWAAIEPAVDKINNKKKKRRFVFWLFFGALLLSGTTAGYWYFFRPAFPGDTANDQIVNAIVDPAYNGSETHTQPGDPSQSEAAEKKAEDDNKASSQRADVAGHTQQKVQASGSGVQSVRHSATATPESASTAPSKTAQSGSNNGVKTGHPATATVLPLQDDSRSTVSNNNHSGNPKALSVDPDQNQETRLLPPIVAEPNTDVNPGRDPSGEPLTIAEPENTDETAENASTAPEPSVTDSAATGSIADVHDDTPATPNSDENNPLIPPAPVQRKAWQFSAALQGGIAFTDRKLEPRADSHGTDLLSLREKTERPLETTQLGVMLEARHRSGFELAAGLQYTRINERFQYLGESVETDTVYGIQFLVRNLYGEIDTIFGGVPLKRTTTFRKEYYNHINLIEIPIMVGYRTSGSDLSFGVRAGVFLNLKTTATGQVLDYASAPVNIEDAGIIKTRIGLSYYLGLSASYKITDNLEIHVSPFARLFPKSITEDSYDLRQKYRLYGLSAGVRLGF